MAYDQNSFLQGIAVGKSLKGWSCGVGTSIPTCWNDEGEYDYFYIDYHLPISQIALPIFKLSTHILCEAGEIEVVGVESIDSTTFKIYCDLTKAVNGWVSVTGYNSMWLYYDNGYAVPEYASVFWVDSKQSYTFGYIEDAGTWKAPALSGTDEETVTYQPGVNYEYADAFDLRPFSCEIEETLTIKYS